MASKNQAGFGEPPRPPSGRGEAPEPRSIYTGRGGEADE